MKLANLTPAQREYLVLLGRAGAAGRLTWRRYKPAVNLERMGLVKFDTSCSLHLTHVKCSVTAEGLRVLAGTDSSNLRDVKPV